MISIDKFIMLWELFIVKRKEMLEKYSCFMFKIFVINEQLNLSTACRCSITRAWNMQIFLILKFCKAFRCMQIFLSSSGELTLLTRRLIEQSFDDDQSFLDRGENRLHFVDCSWNFYGRFLHLERCTAVSCHHILSFPL